MHGQKREIHPDRSFEAEADRVVRRATVRRRAVGERSGNVDFRGGVPGSGAVHGREDQGDADVVARGSDDDR